MKSRTMGLLAATLLLPLAANAVPIDGEIIIGGALLPTCGGTSTNCTMDIADGIDFFTGGGDDTAIVTATSGDFDGLFGQIVAMTDFTFDPFATVDPLWTVEQLSFALDSLNVAVQTGTALVLSGTGTIANTSYDDTFGAWSLSADAANPTVSFGWSSTTLAPEPGILVLMGIGLIGGFGARRLTR